MESGMTTTEIQLDHLYVSITQVLNEYLPYPIYPYTLTKDLSSMIYYACQVYQFNATFFRARKYWWLGVLELLLPLQQHLWRRHPDTDKRVQGFYRRRSRVSWGTIRNCDLQHGGTVV